MQNHRGRLRLHGELREEDEGADQTAGDGKNQHPVSPTLTKGAIDDLNVLAYCIIRIMRQHTAYSCVI